MTFLKLVNTTPLNGVFQKLLILHKKRQAYREHDLRKIRKAYTHVIEELRSLKPKKTNFKFLFVIGGDEDKNVHMGRTQYDSTNWGTDMTDWKELLSMEVITMHQPENALAYLLWEITFYGYTSKAVKEEREKLKKYIKKHTTRKEP